MWLGGQSSAGEGTKKPDSGDGEESGELKEAAVSSAEGGRLGAKPQLRVYIPGQKEFVPKTVSLMHNFFSYAGIIILLFVARCFSFASSEYHYSSSREYGRGCGQRHHLPDYHNHGIPDHSRAFTDHSQHILQFTSDLL